MKRIIVTCTALVLMVAGCSSSPDSSNVTPTATVQPADQTTAAPSSLVYRDDSLGYSFTYPAGWKIDKAGYNTPAKEIAVRSSQKSVFGDIVIRFEPGTIDKVRTGMGAKQYTEQTTTIGGQAGYMFTTTAGAGQTTTSGVYVTQRNNMLLITADMFQQEQVQKILSSFKFF